MLARYDACDGGTTHNNILLQYYHNIIMRLLFIGSERDETVLVKHMICRRKR
jgi:hypothetical protein